jgi:hypothetical protein
VRQRDSEVIAIILPRRRRVPAPFLDPVRLGDHRNPDDMAAAGLRHGYYLQLAAAFALVMDVLACKELLVRWYRSASGARAIYRARGGGRFWQRQWICGVSRRAGRVSRGSERRGRPRSPKPGVEPAPTAGWKRRSCRKRILQQHVLYNIAVSYFLFVIWI